MSRDVKAYVRLTFGNFDFLLEDVVGDVVLQDDAGEQKVDVVSFNESIKSLSEGHINLWCILLFQNGDPLTLVWPLTVIA